MKLVKDKSYNFGKFICKCELIDCVYMLERYIKDMKKDNYQEYICGVYDMLGF